MKRAYPGLVESRQPHSLPRVSFLLERIYLKLYIFTGNSPLEALTCRIQAGLGRASHPAISGGLEVFRGLFWRCRQHWQTMFGVSGIYYKIAGAT
jgi:hypothetical protein